MTGTIVPVRGPCVTPNLLAQRGFGQEPRLTIIRGRPAPIRAIARSWKRGWTLPRDRTPAADSIPGVDDYLTAKLCEGQRHRSGLHSSRRDTPSWPVGRNSARTRTALRFEPHGGGCTRPRGHTSRFGRRRRARMPRVRIPSESLAIGPRWYRLGSWPGTGLDLAGVDSPRPVRATILIGRGPTASLRAVAKPRGVE